MGANSKIEWTHHTFNPWWGCVEPSPACDNCYAREFAKRLGFDIWGKDKPRRFFGDAHWNEPLKWDRAAAAVGERHRVFCASMGDVLERRDDLKSHRARLWELIARTPNLDWLLLTKRAGNFRSLVPPSWMADGGWPVNVWPGVTVENVEQLQLRAPDLCKLPSLQKFLSMEPLLEDVAGRPNTEARELFTSFLVSGFDEPPFTDAVTWVIAGGESGHKARPAHPDWYRHVRDACHDYGVSFHFKQWGEWAAIAPIYHENDDYEAAIDGVDERRSLTLDRGGVEWADGDGQPPPGSWLLERVGKKAAGRELDGRTWDDIPAVRA